MALLTGISKYNDHYAERYNFDWLCVPNFLAVSADNVVGMYYPDQPTPLLARDKRRRKSGEAERWYISKTFYLFLER
jgi:hypothetical protein